MRAELIPVAGGKSISIVRDVTVVGRQPETCDVILDRNSISKLHCIIVRTDGLLFIRDLGSTNGTKVNGQRVVRGALLPGDELSFASEKFRVEMGPGDPEPREEDCEHAVTEEIVLPQADIVEYFGFTEPGSAAASDPGASDSDVRLLEDDN